MHSAAVPCSFATEILLLILPVAVKPSCGARSFCVKYDSNRVYVHKLAFNSWIHRN